jgi:hypothetical protein
MSSRLADLGLVGSKRAGTTYSPQKTKFFRWNLVIRENTSTASLQHGCFRAGVNKSAQLCFWAAGLLILSTP